MIPIGYSKKLKSDVDINIVNELESPFSDENVEEKLLLTLDQCFTKNPDELINTTPIELYFNIKGWSNAIRGLIYFSCFWNDEIGYVIKPARKVPNKGFHFQKEEEIVLGKSVKPGDLANSMKIAIEKSKK
ncbi:hypothetical protein [Paenibacillus soyae]|uniref:Uncharacterized protein n=1 Tax=Paenibacillus soyae TaxID=2969249 RepID=A0A9X2MNQ3_9BACL|nr:hypothetical protein [Paenibacillus soyae]MCR2803640.1 hypothetical protein [Paenibacillus soyae]